MKKNFINIAVCSAVMLAAVPFAASAEGETETNNVVYGTMNIPYADFYAAEIENAYAVDAVSSATANKWKGNNTGSVGEDGTWQNGGLVAGTYNDDNGTILGVNYPVEVSAQDVEYLTENYGFAPVDEKPVAYKKVTVKDETIEVSKVEDTDEEKTVDGNVTVATQSNYGDYQFTVEGFPTECDYYGVIFNTEEGKSYALRHLENIWRNGSFSWSAGFKTTESHGNTLKYDNFVDSMGKHITSVTYILLDGYYTVNTPSAYIPIKFEGGVTAENGTSGKGSTTYELTGLPDNFSASASAGEGFTTENGTISYENALPGTYTITVSDTNGVYADLVDTFVLSTDDIPVAYNDGKLVTAENFTDNDSANFIKNITSVEVNGTEYRTGRRGVTIVQADGTIDFEAKSGENNVFDGSGNYTIKVNSTGYNNPFETAIENTSAETTTTTEDASSETTTTKANSSSSSSSSSSSKTSSTSSSKSSTGSTGSTGSKASASGDSPQTGVAGAAIPASVLALAGTAAVIFRKKND